MAGCAFAATSEPVTVSIGGRKIRGRVLQLDKHNLVIQTNGTRQTLPAGLLSPEGIFVCRRALADLKSAEVRYELGKFALEKGLSRYAADEFEAVAKLDMKVYREKCLPLIKKSEGASDGKSTRRASPSGAKTTPISTAPKKSAFDAYWGMLFDKRGKLRKDVYFKIATSYGVNEIHRRLGPNYAYYKRKKSVLSKGAGNDFPLVWQRPIQYRNPKDKAKTGYHVGTPSGKEMQVESEGEIAYVTGNTGTIDAVHTFEYRFNTMRFGPWFRYPGRPDKGIKKWRQDASQPVDMARSAGNSAWNVSSAIAFRSGLIAASGVCTSTQAYPSYKLPPHKVPTAVCVTARNEFILACIWDIRECKGQLAVFAMSSWTPNQKYKWLTEWDWAESYPGMHNTGMWRSMKLLGYVNLPICSPTAISTAASNHPWSFYRGIKNQMFIAKQLPFEEQRVRNDFYAGKNALQVARGGYAVVISPYERKAVWIDLQPLFEYYREMYYTTQAKYDATRKLGPAPDQWPYCFADDDGKSGRNLIGKAGKARPASPRPRVAAVQSFSKPPTAVLASQAFQMKQYSDWGKGPKRGDPWTAVATVDGSLHIFAVGDLLTKTPAVQGVRQTAVIKVGRNPCCLAYRTSGYNHQLKNEIYVVARGDREIQWVKVSLQGGQVFRRLRDKRLLDPVHVVQTATNGKICPILTVCDFEGKQVISYRVGGVLTLHDKKYILCGPKSDSGDIPEVGHIMQLSGHPFRVSDTNVP